MATIYELKRRAQELSAKKDSLSISPEEVGGLIDETLDVINEAEKNQIGDRKSTRLNSSHPSSSRMPSSA